MTDALEYYGRPDPPELSAAAATRFFQIATTAHERFGALPAYDTDMQLIPLDENGGKRPAKGFLPSRHTVPKSREALALLAAGYPDANVGIRSRRAVGANLTIDCDEPGVVERIEHETGRRLPLTYTTQTRPHSAPHKQHINWMSTEHSVSRIKKQVTDVTHIVGYDLKGCGGFGHIAAEGCVRDGEPVVALHDAPIAPIPDWLVDYLVADIAKARSQKRTLARKKPEPAEPETTSPRSFAVAHGDRKWVVKSRIRTFKNLGMNDDEAFGILNRDIREHFEDGDAYLAKLNLRARIREVPTLGRNVSYRILTHRRRRKLRHRMRLHGLDSIAWKRGVGCGDDGRRGELGDRNMIGMPVSTVGSERHDYVGLDALYVSHNSGDSLAGVRTVELLIVVVED